MTARFVIVFELIASIMASFGERDDVIKDSLATLFLFLRPMERGWKLHFLT